MHPLIAAALRVAELKRVFHDGSMYFPIWQNAMNEEIEFMRELGYERSDKVGS
jgi:hypothetical protein